MRVGGENGHRSYYPDTEDDDRAEEATKGVERLSWSTAWRVWVGGASRLQPRPRFRLRLAPELMADRDRIIERLTPDQRGHVSVAELFQSLATVASSSSGAAPSSSGAAGQGLPSVPSSSLGTAGRRGQRPAAPVATSGAADQGGQLPFDLGAFLQGPAPAGAGRGALGAGGTRPRGGRRTCARVGRGQTRSRPSGRGRGAGNRPRPDNEDSDLSEDLRQVGADSAGSA